MSDQLKLLPCPFCGGPAEHSTYSGAPVIWCKAFGECQGMMGGEEYDGTAEQLAASWNTRPALDTSPGSTLKVMRGQDDEENPIAYMRNEGEPNNLVKCTFACPGAFGIYASKGF